MYKILYLIPKNYLSYFIGKLVSIKLPRPFCTYLVKAFALFFKIDVLAASKSIGEYESIADFFIRDLKEYPALEDAQIISPVEACLRNFGDIIEGRLPQIKGVDYSITDLLGNHEYANLYKGGTFLNFYLSPKNYHQVHSPVSGEICSSTYIQGKLWPVNDWSLNSIKGLFAINERIVTYIDSELGKIALVMVGATNVGKITVSYDKWCTNDIFNTQKLHRISTNDYSPKVKIKAGEKLGVFHMGSAVILLLERKINLTSIVEGSQLRLFSRLV